jgi:hypothetical protein
MFSKIVCLLLAVLLLIAAGLNYEWARSTLEQEAHEDLNQQWAAVKGYLRIEYDPNTRRIGDAWYYDPDDPDEAATVNSIRARCLIADESGRVLRESRTYREIGLDSPARIRSRMGALSSQEARGDFWSARNRDEGRSYLVRAGIVYDEQHRAPYYVAIAAPLSQNERPLLAFGGTLAGAVVCALLLGWWLGRVAPRRATRPRLGPD